MEKIEVLDIDDKPKKLKLKKWVKVVLSFILLLLPIIIVLGVFNYLLSPVSSSSKKVSFKVESGSSVYKVGEKLEAEGLIKNFFAYKVYVKLFSVNEYKAGTYILNTNYGTKKIIDILKTDSYEKEGITITFKEGKTIRGVAKEVSKNTSITEEEFINKVNDEAYINSLIDKYWFLTDEIKNSDIYYYLEGYLFADTYSFSNNPTTEEIIEVMLNQTNKIFTKYKALFEESKYSIHEITTLASIVESEGIYEDDRKNIAGVFYNRLNTGMPLGSDVTTYYAFKVDLGTRDLTKKELNTYNPYNTRGPNMSGKLPIGAISNFSESSLLAALSPNDNDYYYFVADKSGKTHFTKTYAEHEKIISELKRAGNWIEW